MATNKRMAQAKAKAKAWEEEAQQKGEEQNADDPEALLKMALGAAQTQGMSAGEMVVAERTRTELIERSGFDYVDVRDLTPNKENSYTIEPESIKGLAKLIYESKNTTPLIVRDVGGMRQIVDGERRYRAHMLLGEEYGEHWYMVPARVFQEGVLSDEDALFMLHAENIGQRNMTKSERARGIAIVSERIVSKKMEDPDYEKGRRTREILSEQFGLSPRTIAMETNIGTNMGEAGMQALDDGSITKVEADAIAKLPKDAQEFMIDKIKGKEISKEDIIPIAKGKGPKGQKPEREIDEDLKAAKRILKKASKKEGREADRVLIAEIRNLLDEIDPDKRQRQEEI